MVLHHDLEIVSTKAGHLAKFLYGESTSNETVSSAFGLVFEGLLSGNWLKRLLVRLFTFNFLELACKLESRLPGEISINSDTQMTPLFWQKAEELKSVLMKVKESGKSCLKTRHSKNEEYGIQFHHFMANIWGNNGYSEKLCFLGLQNQYG